MAGMGVTSPWWQAFSGPRIACFAFDGRVTLVHYTIADRIRPEAVEAIKSIHALGIQTVLLTGDAKLVAQAIVQELGCTQSCI
jgi:P-type E1-E2 ATPase